MRLVAGHAGHRYTLNKGLRGIALSGVLAAAIGASLWFGIPHVSAGGETRTLSLYHVHTGESLTVTYKVDGRYIPSALEKITQIGRASCRERVEQSVGRRHRR